MFLEVHLPPDVLQFGESLSPLPLPMIGDPVRKTDLYPSGYQGSKIGIYYLVPWLVLLELHILIIEGLA